MKRLFFLILFFSISILTFGANVYFLNGGSGYIYTNGQSFEINQDGYAAVAYWIWADPAKYTYDHSGANFQDPDGNWSGWSDLSGGQGLNHCSKTGTWHVKGRVHVVHDIYGYNDYWMYTSFTLYFNVVAPPPPPGPLAASISGPTTINSGVDATWNATATGGTPPYHYKWWYKYPGGLPLYSTSSSQKVTVGKPIGPNRPPAGYWNPIAIDSPILTRYDYQDHYLKCVVTDAVNTTVTSNIMYIYVSGAPIPPLSPLSKNDLQNNFDKSVLEEKVTENTLGNYPNPFNPSTIIRYQIVKAGQVTLKVYDALGREVANLVDKEQPSGKYSVNFNASSLSSGIYLYRITANDFTAVKKLILTK